MISPSFVIFDVETTGVSAKSNDRIVEIAAVVMGLDGQVQMEYDTLLNPQRDVGPTFIHGISEQMVKNAPVFHEIAGELIPLFQNRIIIGHNVNFDLRFLGAEFARLNYQLPQVQFACTLAMARKSIMPKPHKLTDCCRYWNIDLTNAHTALDDTRATAQMFLTMMNNNINVNNFIKNYTFDNLPPSNDWPNLQNNNRRLSRRELPF